MVFTVALIFLLLGFILGVKFEGHPLNEFEDDHEVYKLIVLSTGHLHVEDNHYLGEVSGELQGIIHSTGFGYNIHLYEDIDIEEEFSSATHNLRHVLHWAYDLGYRYVRFDSDGPIVDELPRFDW